MKRNLIACAVLTALAGCGGGSGTETAAAPVSTVFIGDSITYRWQTTEYAPTAELPAYIVDAGIPGETSSMMLARFKADVLSHHPDVVHILAGTNDCILAAHDQGGNGQLPDFAYVLEMVKEARAVGARVIVGTIPPLAPTHGEWVQIGLQWNDEIRAESTAAGYEVVDYWDALTSNDKEIAADFLADTVHPSPKGYAAMWSAVQGVLE